MSSPHWNIICDIYSAADRKLWSHYGATRFGDLGNVVYHVTLEVCLLLRRRHGAFALLQLQWLGAEKSGDVMEGIMGLHWLHPHGGWGAAAQAVETICVAILDETNQMPYLTVKAPHLREQLLARLFDAMGLGVFATVAQYELAMARRQQMNVVALSVGQRLTSPCSRIVYRFLRE